MIHILLVQTFQLKSLSVLICLAPFLRFLTVPDDLDAGEFTHFVSVILVCLFVLRSLLQDLNHEFYLQIRSVASIRYITGCYKITSIIQKSLRSHVKLDTEIIMRKQGALFQYKIIPLILCIVKFIDIKNNKQCYLWIELTRSYFQYRKDTFSTEMESCRCFILVL